MDASFVKAFRKVVREEILKKNRISIKGLGRFEVTHEKQHQQKYEDGRIEMMPPRDRIMFTPEKKDRG